MKKIIFTGGGTAGHVSPNIALIQKLKETYPEEDLLLAYIGSKNGIEKEMVAREGIAYYGISGGKLRRYRSLKNLTDPFRVVAGIFQAIGIIRKLRPDVVFSKGGFVAVPAVVAAFVCRVPVLIHESDYSPGLATRISSKLAKTICLTFEDTGQYLAGKKTITTGTPIRKRLQYGNKGEGYGLTGFSSDKPVILVMGGSQGSLAINQAVVEALPELSKDYQIVHLVGRGNAQAMPQDQAGYVCFEFLAEELAHVFAITDFVISRAGSNAIFEFLEVKKPMLLIPLPLSASRGDQILNAQYFQKKGYAHVLDQEDLTAASLVSAVKQLDRQSEEILLAMQTSSDGTDNVLSQIEAYLPVGE